IKVMVSSFPIIDAVIEGLQDGKIFRPGDDAEFILHKSCFSYLSANGNTDAGGMMAFFIGTGSLPVYYHIYDAQPYLISGFQGYADRFNLKIRERVQLQFRGRERMA